MEGNPVLLDHLQVSPGLHGKASCSGQIVPSDQVAVAKEEISCKEESKGRDQAGLGFVVLPNFVARRDFDGDICQSFTPGKLCDLLCKQRCPLGH